MVITLNRSFRMITLSADFDSTLTTLLARGLLTQEDLCAAALDFIRDHATPRALWDFTGADLTRISTRSLEMVFSAVGPDMAKCGGGRSALLFSSKLGFGLGRMSEALAEIRGFPCAIKAFSDRETAMSWLRYRPGSSLLDGERPGIA